MRGAVAVLVMAALGGVVGCGKEAPDACDAYASIKAQCIGGPAEGLARRRDAARAECRAAKDGPLPVRDAMKLATGCAAEAAGSCEAFDRCVRANMSLGK